jgi:hypothetical protein
MHHLSLDTVTALLFRASACSCVDCSSLCSVVPLQSALSGASAWVLSLFLGRQALCFCVYICTGHQYMHKAPCSLSFSHNRVFAVGVVVAVCCCYWWCVLSLAMRRVIDGNTDNECTDRAVRKATLLNADNSLLTAVMLHLNVTVVR